MTTTATPRQDPELVVDSIITQIQDNIGNALSLIRSDREDPRVKIPVPAKYYISAAFNPNLLPAVYVVADYEDFQLEMKQANHINSKISISVSLVNEAETSDLVTRQSYRYQAALHMVLNQATILLSGNLLKYVVTIDRVSYSPLFTSDQEKNLFRKEVVLECSVYCYENY